MPVTEPPPVRKPTEPRVPAPTREEPLPLTPRNPDLVPETCPRPRVNPSDPDVETCRLDKAIFRFNRI